MRRAITSGRQATGPGALRGLIHSSTSARALARVMPKSAARRWRSQPKPSSATAHSSDGGSISNGERPSQITTLPANTKRPGVDFGWRGWRRRCADPAARSAAGRRGRARSASATDGCRWHAPSAARAGASMSRSLVCAPPTVTDIIAKPLESLRRGSILVRECRTIAKPRDGGKSAKEASLRSGLLTSRAA